jgi:hypothetical protein
MLKNISIQRKYDLFVFVSVFGKSLAEIYIPVLLYNKGFGIESILFYFLIKYLSTAITYYPVIRMGIKINIKYLVMISALFLGATYYLLSLPDISTELLMITAVMFSLFSQTYWTARHYYAIEIVDKPAMTGEVGNIIAASELAIIPSAYIGALIINYLGLGVLTIVITAFILISTIPIFNIDTKKLTYRKGIRKTLKNIPRNSLLVILVDQVSLIIRNFFPLYIYLYVASNYQYIGILNIIVGLSSILFIYFFCYEMDKHKKDYLTLSAILLGGVFLLKLNIVSSVLMILAVVLEGFVFKMYNTSITRDIYALAKDYNTVSYLIIHEVISNLARVIMLVIGILFIKDLVLFLYFCAIIFILTSFIEFDDGKGGYHG